LRIRNFYNTQDKYDKINSFSHLQFNGTNILLKYAANKKRLQKVGALSVIQFGINFLQIQTILHLLKLYRNVRIL